MYFAHRPKPTPAFPQEKLNVWLEIHEAGQITHIVVGGSVVATLEFDVSGRVFLRRRRENGLSPEKFRCASDGGIWTSSERRKEEG